MSEPTLSRDEMAVYDALLRLDSAACMHELAGMVASYVRVTSAVATLVASGVCWREGNIVGLVQA